MNTNLGALLTENAPILKPRPASDTLQLDGLAPLLRGLSTHGAAGAGPSPLEAPNLGRPLMPNLGRPLMVRPQLPGPTERAFA